MFVDVLIYASSEVFSLFKVENSILFCVRKFSGLSRIWIRVSKIAAPNYRVPVGSELFYFGWVKSNFIKISTTKKVHN